MIEILSWGLFGLGTVMAAITGIMSWYSPVDAKHGVIAFPFALLAAAAVAKYLGA